MSTPATSSASSPSSSVPVSSASTTLLTCFVRAPFFEPDAASSSARSGASASWICCAAVATCSCSRGASLRSERVAVARTSSRIFFGSSVETVPASSGKIPDASERTSSSVGRPASSAQLRETAGPEVVVLVEALVLALGEVVAAPLEPLLERGERLVAVDVDLLRLGLDLVLEVVQVLRARLDVDRRHDRGGEVEHLLELARGDVEQVADPAGNALEEPDVADRERRGRCDPCARGAPSGASPRRRSARR